MKLATCLLLTATHSTLIAVHAAETVAALRLQEQIGHGHYSRVFKAVLVVPPQLPRLVAAKMVCKDQRAAGGNATFTRRKEQIQAIANEIVVFEYLAAHEGSSSIPRLHYYGSFLDDHNLYIVTECCLCDLFELVKGEWERNRQMLSREAIRSVLLDVAEGVRYLHSLSIIHRDIKSENILISQEGRALLADFNLALIETEPSSPSASAVSQVACGTASFVPYEIAAALCGYSCKADVWALGILAYLLASLRYPFPLKADPPFSGPMLTWKECIEQTCVDYSPVDAIDVELTQVVKSCLEFDPLIRQDINGILGASWFTHASGENMCRAREEIASLARTQAKIAGNRPHGGAPSVASDHVSAKNSQRFDKILQAQGCHHLKGVSCDA